MATSRQRGTRSKAIAVAEKNGTAVTRTDATASVSSVMSKVDKTGLYDLQQVKRVLDDQVIDVRSCCLFLVSYVSLVRCCNF